MSKYDFHLHSSYSDGYWNIDGILENAKNLGMKGLVLTDHDNIIGQKEFTKEAEKLGFLTTTGVEITTKIDGQRLDILGYGMDIENDTLSRELVKNREAKNKRDDKLLVFLKDKGFIIDDARVVRIRKEAKGYLGRVKIANLVLENEENLKLIKVPTWDGLWEEYLKPFSSIDQLGSREAIELIHQAGGVASLAHPGDDMPDYVRFEEITSKLIKAGLDGIEVYSWKHSKEQCEFYNNFAQKNNLLITFGSDDHGWPNNKRTLGHVFVENEEELAKKFFARVN